MTRALVGGVFLLLGLAAPAAATPITWGFQGSVVASQIAAFPVGTAVTLDWVADAAAPNACASLDPAVGIYFGQSLTETIGGMSYTIGGILTVGTTLSRGCFGAPDTSVRLNLINWSGPNVVEGPIVPFWPCCNVPSMLWLNGAPTHQYPFRPPDSALLSGPYFAGGRAAVTVAVQAVPEPATLSLLLLGGLVMRRHIMNA
jgi:hypothetical protein